MNYSKCGKKFIIGIDEVGRGPLAGPVTVCAFAAPSDFDFSVFVGATDSKQMTKEAREEVFAKLQAAKKKKTIDFHVSFVSHSFIDKKGIVPAISHALQVSLSKLKITPSRCRILLDGNLKAPARFKDQQTIIKGDAKEIAISLASIAAKVMRDKHMTRLAKRYPGYRFEQNMGYGTLHHRKAILELGPAPIHRRTFIKNLDKAVNIANF